MTTSPKGATSAAEWSRPPLKYVLRNVTEKGRARPTPFVALEHIQPKVGTTVPGFDWEDAQGDSYVGFDRGDVLFSKLRPYLAKVLAADRPGCCSSELLVLRPTQVLARYAYWLMLSKPVVERAVATSTGVKMPRTRWDRLGREPVELPRPETQRAITGFLDRETTRIDALVAAKQQLAARVHERFVAFLAERTLGRTSEGGLRETGLPWIGAIPTSWKMMRLKDIAKMESGHTPNRQKVEYWVDCHIPWVTLNDLGALEWRLSIENPKNQINALGLANSSARILPSDTVILSRDATVGRTALLGRPMAISQHFVGWVCGDGLLPEYLLHLLRGPGKAWCDSVTAGSTILTIGMPDLRRLAIPVPPLNEQREIANICSQVTTETEQVLDSISRQTALLQERRQALITAAVSGELRIPVAA